jgi:hypothetical protein
LEASESLNAAENINSVWETNMNISAKESLGYELEKHKPWYDEGCSELFDSRKQVKLH